MDNLKYPVNCTVDVDKLVFCLIAQEKLRLEHNAKGKDFREGKITETEWKSYLKNTFDVTSDLIVKDLLKYRIVVRESTKYIVDLTDLEATKE